MVALRALRHERALVVHIRIALRPGCLAALPTEFHLITPRVWVDGTAGRLPYLDLRFSNYRSVVLYLPAPRLRVHYDRNTWLAQVGRRYPQIDGAFLCVRRSPALAASQSKTVASGKGEDAEWSLRLLHQGKVPEIELESHTDSPTCKTCAACALGRNGRPSSTVMANPCGARGPRPSTAVANHAMTDNSRLESVAGAGPRRIRVLALGPQPVWPAIDGGKEGIHGALEALTGRVDLVYACPCPQPTEESRAHFQAVGVDYRPVQFEPRESLGVILSSTVQLKSFKFHKYGTRAAVDAFARALQGVRPDAVLCFHAHMEEMGQRLRRRNGWHVPLMVREHNIEYELVASYRASLPPLRRLAAAPFEWLTRRAEQRIWARADATAFLSDRDHHSAVATGTPSHPVLAPEGVPLPPRRAVKRSDGPPRLLIPLNQRATQSVLNLRQFLHEYWAPTTCSPALQSTTLAITGVDAARLHELTGLSPADQQRLRVQALGFLPSLQPAFESALALVSPTFVGGGIRKKVLEGMAHQVPVIATDLDIDTCGFFDPPRNILRLGTPPEFAATVEALARDATRWHAIAEAGRDTVERHASWDGFAAIVMAELERLVQATRGPA